MKRRDRDVGVPQGERRFRRVNPAASLKQGLPACGNVALPGFPPGKSGGLIEAWSRKARATALVQSFPPGKSGGLIEA